MKQKERITVIPAKNLVEGEDFEVVTYVVIDENRQLTTLESFFEIDQLDLIKKYPEKKDFLTVLEIQALFNRDWDESITIQRTPIEKEPGYFYQLNGIPLNLDLLLSLGF